MDNIGKLIVAGDKELFYLINRRTNCKILDVFMRNITNLGSVTFNISLIIIFTLLKNLMTDGVGFKLAASLFLNQLLVQSTKRIVNRPRPYKALTDSKTINPPKCKYSFPSGHTSASFTTAFLLGNLFPLYAPSLIVIASLVGISRIYLGVHYPTDVFVGVFIAYISVLFTALL